MTRAARLLRLVSLLDTRSGRTREQLAGELGVSERTLYRDLSGIEELGIPLVQLDGRYRLVDGASWRPLLLTVQERATLRLLLGTPALRREPAMRRRLESLASKLTAAVDGAAEGVVLADLERSGPVLDTLVPAIEDAIARQQTLRIDYVSISSQSRRIRRVDPWALFHRGEAWYLAGRCHENGGPRMFRLDRVRAATATGDLFLRPENFDVEAWLRNAWSLFQGGDPREVVIEFEPDVASLVESARHHEGESVRILPGGAAEYRVTLAHVEEIARWIVTFGGKARAIEPEELVARVREIAEGVTNAHPSRWGTGPVAAARIAKSRDHRSSKRNDRN
ncbi:MAG: WYL domain-containing protein [Thermoanaerobaculia bacterium]|nr:WYL domain-containing protein [Thermoanaerobaculia bacterium]